MEILLYKLWWLSFKEISLTKKYKLYEYFGDAYHVYFATKSELLDSLVLSKTEVEDFILNRSKSDLIRIYDEFIKTPFSFVTIEDDDYPKQLRTIYNPPYGLFYYGKLPQLDKTVSIVGARGCSEYGKHMASLLGKELSDAGFTIVSGMAKGIDTFAHIGCLQGKSATVAVLGNGVDEIYPKENHLLYEEIASHGAVVSEFPIGTKSTAKNFPIRNRIVAGLSKSIIVVEARLKSGSLITADLALEQGKDIYVVPGRVGDKLSEGCNKLITQGAGVICSIDGLLEELSPTITKPVIGVKKEENKISTLTKEQLLVYSYFDFYPISIATVQEKSGIDYLHLISVIFSLVNFGLLKEVFKNEYVICG